MIATGLEIAGIAVPGGTQFAGTVIGPAEDSAFLVSGSGNDDLSTPAADPEAQAALDANNNSMFAPSAYDFFEPAYFNYPYATVLGPLAGSPYAPEFPHTEELAQSVSLTPPTDKPVNLEEMHKALKFRQKGPGDIGNYIRILLSDKDQGKVIDIKNEALAAAKSQFPNSVLTDDKADAFRHAYWSFRMAQELGEDWAKQIGDGHERSPFGNYSGRASETSKGATIMDLYNNQVGRDLFRETGEKDPNLVAGIVLEALELGRLQEQPFDVSR